MAVENSGSFKPGKRKTNGRTRGQPNKVSGELRLRILGALDKAGGEEYLARMASEEPKAFLQLLGRLLPRPVELEGEPGTRITHTIELVPHTVAED